MTREEAANMLKARLECLKCETSGINLECTGNCDECSLCYEQGNLREQKEALDMAIKALEQQPCEDTISRKAAIGILDAFQVKVENGEEFSYSWARMRMTELPSARQSGQGVV